MTLKTNTLRDAITFALAVGATAVAGTGIAFAQDATTPAPAAPADQQATNLDRIEVTGSRIRRVDAENASPVVTIDRAAIEKTGKLTIGEIVQELPNIAGAATNPTVNNGGGTGASTVDLRGLGSQRTLILVNGRRVVHQGGTDGGADVNAIPASAVERIEVLTVGASSVYGSDAVAGVVNFIMRKDFEGMQASIDYGISDRQDGQRQGGSFTFGQVGEKGNVIAGVNYNKFDAISSGDRDFSKDATYLYAGYVTKIGSSRNPRGYIKLADTDPTAIALGCTTLTRIPGAAGTDPTNDYRCYSSAADSYNYQAVNLVQTPQERSNAFFLGNFQMTDDTSAFIEYYHNKTASNFAIAALPFDARGDAVLISADNYYNPFGVDFGRNDSIEGNDFRSRWTSVGQRRSLYNTTTDQIVAGFEGFLGETWKWDFGLNYGHISQYNQSYGYMDYAGLAQALGPSFLDPTTGVVTCGTAANPIPLTACTPLNVFNIEDPQTIATLTAFESRPIYSTTYVSRGFEANASGELFDLPAGAAQLAFGAAWRREYQRSEVDYTAIARPDGTCSISQEACSTPLSGGFSVGEMYGELFVPVLKDMPFAKALNVTFGTRFSDYSNFGNTTNSKLQVEWRPLDDLLFRGTVAEVFRAPSIGDLFAGPQGNAPTATDPCVGYTNDPAHVGACGAPTGAINIPTGGITSTGLSQTTGVISGSVAAGYDLQPEQGKSFDWGVVYDPSWLPGFSASLDYWRLYLNDTITVIGAQTVLNSCYADSTSPFCPFIHRFQDGQINFIQQPTVNLGRLDVKGWDLALRYKLPDTSWGAWNFGLDSSYIAQWDNDVDTNSDLDAVLHIAGHYNKDYGMYSRVRGRLFANWSLGDWSASWRIRYTGPFDVGNADVRQGSSGDASIDHPGVELPYGSYVNHSFNVGYALPSINSRVELGVDNVFDKQPPLLYQNNVLNANTDPSTFDTIGRYYWARYTVKF
jgi:outer membrane receptor protein involved in Fe transport